MPGVIAIHEDVAIGYAIRDLLIAIGAGNPEDFQDQVVFIPI
jgi:hypothetical protein